MIRILTPRPLTREAFAPFGDVIDKHGPVHYPINGGMTERYHDLADVQTDGERACVLINLFAAKPYGLPLVLTLVERHPLGSQAFMPLGTGRWLVIVCPDEGDRPGTPCVFLAGPGQGVNYPPGRWHGVLTALDEPQDFLVVDRGGEGNNLEEHVFQMPYQIVMQ